MNLSQAVNQAFRLIDPKYRMSATKLIKGAVIDSLQYIAGRRHDDVFERDTSPYGQFSRYPFKDLIHQCYRPISDSMVNATMVMKDEKVVDSIVYMMVNTMSNDMFSSYVHQAIIEFGKVISDDEDITTVEVFHDDNLITGVIRLGIEIPTEGIEDFSSSAYFDISHQFSTKGAYYSKVDINLVGED